MQEAKVFEFRFNASKNEYEFWCNKHLLVTATDKYIEEIRNLHETGVGAFKRYCGKILWDLVTTDTLFSDRAFIYHVFSTKYERKLDNN